MLPVSIELSSQNQSLQLQLLPDFHEQPNVEQAEELSTVISNCIGNHEHIENNNDITNTRKIFSGVTTNM